MSNLPSNRLYNLPLPPPPRNRQVRFTLKSSVRFTPPPPKIGKSDLPSNHLYNLPPTPPPPQKLPSPIYPQIAKSDLPSNHLYDLPPRNRQVRFTLKSPSPIYPQIVCTIYPPFEIAKSDLPSNCQVRFTLKSSVRFPPRNRQVRFTLKSPSPIVISSVWFNF